MARDGEPGKPGKPGVAGPIGPVGPPGPVRLARGWVFDVVRDAEGLLAEIKATPVDEKKET